MKKLFLSMLAAATVIVFGVLWVHAAALGVSTSAAIGANSNTSAGEASAGATTTTSVKASLEVKAQERATQEIERRVTALTALETRITAMNRVSTEEKTNLQSMIGAQITALNGLKTKISADTDATTIKTDVASITKSYRIFALIMPQGSIAAASDRITATVTLMTELGTKLQTRISDASSAGHDVASLQSSYSDYTAKLADAKTQAAAAVTLTANLTPDNGDATIMQANKTALTNARADIKAAITDLQAARKDAETIVKTLKGWTPAASTSTSTSTSTQGSV